MKVVISVHGRYHAFDLAKGLQARGCSVQVTTTYPRFAARRFLPANVRLRCAPWLEAWRRAEGRIPAIPATEPGLHRAFGRFAARSLPAEADLLVGWSSATLEAIPVARARGMAVIVERGSTHILHQNEVLAAEYERLGLPPVPIHPVIMERELAEYAQADAIAIPTAYVAETFMARGVARDKLIVNPYGIDEARLKPPCRRSDRSGKPKILFVGQVGVRKGVATLLRAFARLRGRAELHLVGPVEPAFRPILRREIGEDVYLHGSLSGDSLAAAYAGADVFCLPSVEEGFGLVLLEAMAAGLPVIATDVTGGRDLVVPEVNGWMIPAGREEPLSEVLRDALSGRRRLAEMGAAGRRRIDEAFTLAHYCDRAAQGYRNLLRARKNAHWIGEVCG